MAIFNKARKLGYDYNERASAEGKRLKVQSDLLLRSDKPIYTEVMNRHLGGTVLDIGCNEGDAAMSRFEGLEVGEYVGIDVSEVAVQHAQEKYGDDDTHFFVLDVMDNNAASMLASVLRGLRIDRVDVICISFVLLHVSDPDKLLKLVYPFLNVGGQIIIKDIDDGDNRATPDPDGRFAESYKIAATCRNGGNRIIGREIPRMLKSTGFRDIACRVKGISSIGMNEEQKQALWDTYYGFFTEVAKQECKYTNGGQQAIWNYGWCHYWLPTLHERFMAPTFEFTLGICTYTATKEA